MPSYIFAYGTLIRDYYDRFPVVVEADGFKRVFSPHPLFKYSYPFVLKRPGCKVRGILALEPDDSALRSIDKYEGYPDLYTREQVPVQIVSDDQHVIDDTVERPIQAWIYVPSPKTMSLRLDRVFKLMKQKQRDAYIDMMENDLWRAKMEQEMPDLKAMVPALFESSCDEAVLVDAGEENEETNSQED
jgi:gamma-glutamylcyclotransferase (GGCT)/AIG2-like uncharacterized protein YtfP